MFLTKKQEPLSNNPKFFLEYQVHDHQDQILCPSRLQQEIKLLPSVRTKPEETVQTIDDSLHHWRRALPSNFVPEKTYSSLQLRPLFRVVNPRPTKSNYTAHDIQTAACSHEVITRVRRLVGVRLFGHFPFLLILPIDSIERRNAFSRSVPCTTGWCPLLTSLFNLFHIALNFKRWEARVQMIYNVVLCVEKNIRGSIMWNV